MERDSINTVAEAIRFLRSINVEAIGVGHGWILHGVGTSNADFELTCDTNAEVIEHARYERDLCVKLCDQLGLDSFADLVALWNSYSPAAADASEQESNAPSALKKAKEVTK